MHLFLSLHVYVKSVSSPYQRALKTDVVWSMMWGPLHSSRLEGVRWGQNLWLQIKRKDHSGRLGKFFLSGEEGPCSCAFSSMGFLWAPLMVGRSILLRYQIQDQLNVSKYLSNGLVHLDENKIQHILATLNWLLHA